MQGMEVARCFVDLFLCQEKYILDVSNETGMLGAKPSSFPIKTTPANRDLGMLFLILLNVVALWGTYYIFS